MAIGAVHTQPAHRGKGYAAELIRGVEQQRRREGATISMLYSDIEPTYYAKLGYVKCPSWHGSSKQNTPPTAHPDDGWRLEPCRPHESIAELAQWYAGFHGAAAIAVARSRDDWEFTLVKSPADEFYWLRDSNDSTRGYLRVRVRDGRPQIDRFRLGS